MREPDKNRRITDKEMLELANQLHGWTKSVYLFGCAFIHLSGFHDYQDRDPLSMIDHEEKILMGAFYTNITLATTDQAKVLEILTQQQRVAYVATPQNGYTVVFDEVCESQDLDILDELASTLSKRLACVAFAVLLHDDDSFVYRLYQNGELTDKYDSPCGGAYGDESPGDAKKLCQAFGVPTQANLVADILQRPTDWGSYIFAQDRHSDLADALNLPTFTVGLGYNYIQRGEAADFDLAEEDLTHIG